MACPRAPWPAPSTTKHAPPAREQSCSMALLSSPSTTPCHLLRFSVGWGRVDEALSTQFRQVLPKAQEGPGLVWCLRCPIPCCQLCGHTQALSSLTSWVRHFIYRKDELDQVVNRDSTRYVTVILGFIWKVASKRTCLSPQRHGHSRLL